MECECGCGQEVKPGNRFITGHNRRLKDGTKRKNKWGYISIKKNGIFIPEHRLILEEYLGRPLEKDEDCHHIDEIPSNNWIENLELCLHSVHSRFHNMGNKHCLGKQNSLGYKHTEKHKKELRIAMLGNKYSLGKSHPQSPETRDKISKARKGMQFSDDHRKNIGIAAKAAWAKRKANATKP